MKPRTSLLLMALPCFMLLIAFSYVPLYGWVYTFFEYKPGVPLSDSAFVGWKYFELAFADREVFNVLRNTLVISFLSILCSPLPVFFAIMLSEVPRKRYKNILQTVTTLPNFVSWVLVYSIFFSIFAVDDGLLNQLMFRLGITDEPTNLLANPDIAWYFQTAVGIWKGLGFSAIIYFAAITGIDPEQYDAAKVDGAGLFQMMRHITIPGIIPTYLTLLLLGIGSLLSNGMEQFYVFNNALVEDKIQVLDLYVYKIGLTLGDYSYSIAIGMAKTFVSLVLLFIANWIAKKVRGESIL